SRSSPTAANQGSSPVVNLAIRTIVTLPQRTLDEGPAPAPDAATSYSCQVQFLSPTHWEPRLCAHEARVDRLLADHVARQSRGAAHPVEDFLFTYYPF